MAQLCPRGRRSMRTTFVESPVPPAVTTMLKIALAPAATGEPTALLTTLMSGQFTVMEALALVGPKFVAETVAVLFTVPQLALTVGLVTCTLKFVPPAR